MDCVRDAAEAADIPMACLAIAWVLHNPSVAAAIVGASRPEQLRESAAAADLAVPTDLLQLAADTLAPFASTSGGAWRAQAATSSKLAFPHSTAAVHMASTQARECRIPRGSRGSGTRPKHSGRFPPRAARSAAARDASSARVSLAAPDTGMRNSGEGNGTPWTGQ